MVVGPRSGRQRARHDETAARTRDSASKNGGIITGMPKRKAKKRAADEDPLAAYRRVRKRVPPPGRVAPDRREKLRERAERQDQNADRNAGQVVKQDGS